MKEIKDRIPIFKTWTHWYVFVLVFLVLLIIMFSIFTKTYS